MNKKYLWSFLALIAVYIALAFILPTNPETLNRYEISENQARLLNLTIVIPLSAVYLVALYGFLRFKSYADSIKDSKEGEPFLHLSTGLMVLAFGLPITSILGALLNYMEFQYTDLVASATIVRNYVSLLFALLAFLYLARGAEGLRRTLKNKKIKSHPVIRLLGPIMLASLFTWLITSQSPSEVSEPVYYMPNWLIILTLVVPYVYIWCAGINAVRNLYVYKERINGFIYKRAINYLEKGIAIIISLSIILQFMSALSAQINQLNLTPLLGVVYVLVFLYVLGYGLVGRGAKRLKQIEEV